MRVLIFRFALLSFALLALASCSREPGRPGELAIGIESAPMNLDPRIGTDGASESLHQLLFNGLLAKNERLELIPDLAESWEQTSAVEYRFRLRPGVRFHNGKECLCEDVRFTFQSIVSDSILSPKRKTFQAIEAIECLDSRTVSIRLDRPNASFPVNLTHAIVPQGAGAAFSEHPIGTGPFRYVETRPEGDVVLEAAADHFGGLPASDRLVFHVIPDEVVRCLELEKGTIDLCINNIPPDMVNSLERRSNVKVLVSPGSNYNYLGFNFEDPILKKRDFREAVALGINREEIIRYLLRGFAEPATGILPPASPFYNPNVRTYPYNPKKAMEALDRAGFPDPDGPGPKFRVEISYKTSNDKLARLQATVIQEQLARIGIRVKIRSYEFPTFYSDIKKGNFQLFSLRWLGISDPEVYEYVFHSKSAPPNGANRGRYRNPKVDELIEAGKITFDEGKRKAIYGEIQRILAEDLPYISLWYPHNIAVIQRDIEGFTLLPSGNFTPLRGAYRKSRRP